MIHTSKQTMREAWDEIGRLVSQLKVANAARTVLPHWYEDLVNNLVGETALHLVRLTQAHKERQLTVLAYNARGLLELYVWTKYCVSSEQKAKRFREDMVRDSTGIYEALKKLSTVFPNRPQASVPPEKLKQLETLTRQKASEFGVSSVDTNYKRVNKAAEEIGLRNLFVNTNTLLSKLAHPTAFTVLTFPQAEALDDMCEGVAKMGLYFAGVSIECISQFIRGLGIAK